MGFITTSYTSFFEDLEENNRKEWFHANKKRYENDVKGPFLKLLDSLLTILAEWDSRIPDDAKKALFRINRDIRFSKDKSPYNTIMKAGFSPNGKKSVFPGYYLGIDKDDIHVGGGLFMIKAPELKKVRELIKSDTESFVKIIEAKDFKNSFGVLSGEKAKRLDKGLLPVVEKTDLIYNKQFYAMTKLPLKKYYYSDTLDQVILGYFENIRPLNTFLNKALI